jgi:hypothetical protein
MVARIAFNSSVQAPQLSRCLFSSAVASLNPAATSGIRSRISLQFITTSPLTLIATYRPQENIPGKTVLLHKFF